MRCPTCLAWYNRVGQKSGPQAMPLLSFKTKKGAPFTVAADYAPRFQGFLNDLETAGYEIDPQQSGGYNPRNIAGTNKPSNHAFGRAIDVNWSLNPRGSPGNLPANVGDIAKRHGLTWGGTWSNPDPMHFEVADAVPVPVAQRSITAFAGLTPPDKGGANMPIRTTYDVPMQTQTTAPDWSAMADQSITTRRKKAMAEALMETANQKDPPRSWLEGLSRGITKVAGAYYSAKADEAERNERKALIEALAGKGPMAQAAAATGNQDIIAALAKSEIEEGSPRAQLQRQYTQALIDQLNRKGDPVDMELAREKTRSEIEKNRRGHVAEENPPTGYLWRDRNDPSKGLDTIPGGPAEKLPEGAAGRLALMRNSVKAIEGVVGPDGKKTGGVRSVYEQPWGLQGAGQSMAANVPIIGDISTLSGDIGRAQREVRMGVEATLRAMTGAAAPESEVNRYAEMFTPGVRDTVESAKQKLDNLTSFMRDADALVTQGRGGPVDPSGLLGKYSPGSSALQPPPPAATTPPPAPSSQLPPISTAPPAAVTATPQAPPPPQPERNGRGMLVKGTRATPWGSRAEAGYGEFFERDGQLFQRGARGDAPVGRTAPSAAPAAAPAKAGWSIRRLD
jgi:hypothetical protein